MNQEKLARLVASMPTGLFNILYMGRRVKRDLQLLNSKAQFLCAIVDKQTVPLEEETIENAREQIENLSGLLSGSDVPVGSVEDFSIPGNVTDIPVRLYKAENSSDPVPVLVFYHGGGFIRGSINSHDGLCRRLVKYGEFAVLSVDYRLAPEHPFPAAVDDAYAALKWVQQSGASKGLDQQRVAVGGDSSGGNLAAVACQDARRQNTSLPAFQLLLYPTTDANFTARSHQLFANGFFLTEERMHWYRDQYLQSPDLRNDVRASPGLENDLSGLSPALIITAGFDPLRDEAEEYAQRLKDAGVPMGIIRHESMIHGFMSLTGLLEDAENAIKMAAETTKSALGIE
ncbi:MAG: alpha/beta hydrolase [Sneathiellales bacterium]|nr:alpha/beta hydrolase [Sneathiellales bacterium]